MAGSMAATTPIKVYFARINRRVPWLGVLAFSVGFLAGYILGLLRLHDRVIDRAAVLPIGWEAFRAPFDWISAMPVSVNFLSDIAAFEAAVIAFLIPLSLEMVARISERYQSEVVLKPFEDEFENRYLLILLLINASLAIFLRFFVTEDVISGALRVLAVLVLVVFVVTAWMIFQFIHKLKKYMTDTDFLMNKLFENAQRAIDE